MADGKMCDDLNHDDAGQEDAFPSADKHGPAESQNSVPRELEQGPEDEKDVAPSKRKSGDDRADDDNAGAAATAAGSYGPCRSYL
jgi:hypothetical protein